MQAWENNKHADGLIWNILLCRCQSANDGTFLYLVKNMVLSTAIAFPEFIIYTPNYKA